MTTTHRPPDAAGTRRPPPPDTLAVSEVYGPVLQGEGAHAGRPCTFLRLMGCNLSCVWCDSRFTWDPDTPGGLRAGTHLRTAADLLDEVAAIGAPTVVITGGEPLLQQGHAAWTQLLHGIRDTGRDTHIETNGTIEPTPVTLGADAIAVSPKSDHAGPHRGHQDPALHPSWLHMAGVHPGVFFKIVVQDGPEVTAWAEDLIGAGVPPARIWVMPEGKTAEEVMRKWPAVNAAAAAAGVNACTRLHVLAFGQERRR